MCAHVCWVIYLVAVSQSGGACQSACCQCHPGDSENMTHTGAKGFYHSVPDSLGDDTPTREETVRIMSTSRKYFKEGKKQIIYESRYEKKLQSSENVNAPRTKFHPQTSLHVCTFFRDKNINRHTYQPTQGRKLNPHPYKNYNRRAGIGNAPPSSSLTFHIIGCIQVAPSTGLHGFCRSISKK